MISLFLISIGLIGLLFMVMPNCGPVRTWNPELLSLNSRFKYDKHVEKYGNDFDFVLD